MSSLASVRSTVTGVIVALVLGIPAGAIAQTPVSSFDQLPTRLRVGDTVYVTDAGGAEHKGGLVDLSASSLTLRIDGMPRNFAAANVRSIKWRQPDSLRNGVLIGLAIGAGLGAVLTAAACEGEAGCAVWGALIWGGAGTGIGAGIDALTPGKKVLVYSTPSASSTARISMSPLVSPRRQGLAVSVRF